MIVRAPNLNAPASAAENHRATVAPSRPASVPRPPHAAPPIRVVLADANPLYREGLKNRLGDRPADYRLLAGVDHGEAAVTACNEHRPDLLLIELRLGGLQGPALIEQARQASPSTRVVAFTHPLDPPTVWRVLQAGADGLLSKDTTLAELCAAMETVHAGGVHLCPRVQRLLVGGVIRNGQSGVPGASGRWAQLSRRERQVAEHLVEGESPRQIAEHLGLSLKTVDSHRYQLLQRLNLRNVADLTRLAVYEGVIQA